MKASSIALLLLACTPVFSTPIASPGNKVSKLDEPDSRPPIASGHSTPIASSGDEFSDEDHFYTLNTHIIKDMLEDGHADPTTPVCMRHKKEPAHVANWKQSKLSPSLSIVAKQLCSHYKAKNVPPKKFGLGHDMETFKRSGKSLPRQRWRNFQIYTFANLASMHQITGYTLQVYPEKNAKRPSYKDCVRGTSTVLKRCEADFAIRGAWVYRDIVYIVEFPEAK